MLAIGTKVKINPEAEFEFVRPSVVLLFREFSVGKIIEYDANDSLGFNYQVSFGKDHDYWFAESELLVV